MPCPELYLCDKAVDKIIDYRTVPVAYPEGTSATFATRGASAPIAPATRRTSACDLVRSTNLSKRFDLEDLREVIGAYHRRAVDPSSASAAS